MITPTEIVETLEKVNGTYFQIDDLKAYSEKVTKYGEALVKRDEFGKPVSYVLYYNNGPEAFITMVWTKKEEQGKGFAKQLIIELIEKVGKDVLLEVNPENPARYMYQKLKFVIDGEKESNWIMRYQRRLAVMQPYIFPYIGYFHLLAAAETIIFYDDVNYIKGGWINRNRILLNNSDHLFTLPLKGASPNKTIHEIALSDFPRFKRKFLAQIQAAYGKAPYYKPVAAMLTNLLEQEYESIADFAIASIVACFEYIGYPLVWKKSSVCSPSSKGMGRADRLIRMSKELGFQNYINVLGGKELYEKTYFADQGIQLQFVKSKPVSYEQYGEAFVPSLSIIDVLMFNDKRRVKNYLFEYKLV